MQNLRNILRQVYLIPVYLYKGLLSPYMGGSCIYSPTCSTYFVNAVAKHGIIRGTIMGIARITRCSRHYLGGNDPVPDTFSWSRFRYDRKVFRRKRK
ncbi:MAG: membrane protein insertion efficiency factor YidD [Spirochaetia bacterium]|nr:membrane protein insertion efficiency factor YidD [Spirochaetia bacterium]